MPAALPILLALGAAGLLVATGKNASAKVVSGSHGVAPAPLPGGQLPILQNGTGLYDATLPLALEQTVSAMLAVNTNPADLTNFADSLLPDYPIAAGKLRAKAASLSNAAAPSSNPFGGFSPAPVFTPAPPISLPPVPIFTPPIAAPTPAPPPVYSPPTPPPTPPPAAGPIIELPPITIVGSPANLAIPAWDPSWSVPDVSGVAIPRHYRGKSQEGQDIQNDLNNWGIAVNYPSSDLPLTVDGDIGPKSQRVTAAFQTWANATHSAGLQVDGLPGPETQNVLGDFGAITMGNF